MASRDDMSNPKFRLPENKDPSYRETMTSVEQVRAALASPGSQVLIAGVPWPVYKLVALLLGALTFIVVGLITAAVAPAVLIAAATSTVLWVAFGARRNPRA